LISTGSANGEGAGKLLFAQNPGAGLIMTLTTTGVGIGAGITAPTHLLHVGGIARSTSTAWVTSSDARVKEDIRGLSGSLEKLGALRPVKFEYTPAYRAAHSGLEGTFTGFLAQDVEEVFPEMVSTVREEVGGGQALDDFRLLNVGGLLPHVVESVQELKAKNEALRKHTAELEERIRRLEAAMPKRAKKATPPRSSP
jgi:hypothetical protein